MVPRTSRGPLHGELEDPSTESFFRDEEQTGLEGDSCSYGKGLEEDKVDKSCGKNVFCEQGQDHGVFEVE